MTTQKNHTRYNSLDRYEADERVADRDGAIWDEGKIDGIWLELSPGHSWLDCGCIHEWRVKDIHSAMRLVKEKSKQ